MGRGLGDVLPAVASGRKGVFKRLHAGSVWSLRNFKGLYVHSLLAVFVAWYCSASFRAPVFVFGEAMAP